MKLSLKKILTIVAGAIAILTFILAFVAPLKYEIAGVSGVLKAKDVYFGESGIAVMVKQKPVYFQAGAIVPFIGYILIALAGVLLIVRRLLNGTNSEIFILIIALMVIGAALVLLTEILYVSNLIGAKGLSTATEAEVKANNAEKVLFHALSLNTGAIIAIILALVAVTLAIVAEHYIKEK